jgi:hypothetical protein
MTGTIRVWRVRKNHTWIEARLLDAVHTGGIELQFFYNSTLVFARHCASRDDAVAAAEIYLGNLERAGWNAHW